MTDKVYLKIVLLGKSNSGKTCLVTRYITDTFSPEQPPTIGAAFCKKDIAVEGRLLSLAIWDTAGAERFQAMSSMYYRNAKAAIICFDLTDASSFDKAEYWVNQILTNEENCKIYLCGTKLDLIEDESAERAVPSEKVKEYAKSLNAEVIETSSKTGVNVGNLFEKIAHSYLLNNDLLPTKKSVRLRASSGTQRSSCCR